MDEGIPFRAVVADSFYGEEEGFKRSLSESLRWATLWPSNPRMRADRRLLRSAGARPEPVRRVRTAGDVRGTAAHYRFGAAVRNAQPFPEPLRMAAPRDPLRSSRNATGQHRRITMPSLPKRSWDWPCTSSAAKVTPGHRSRRPAYRPMETFASQVRP